MVATGAYCIKNLLDQKPVSPRSIEHLLLFIAGAQYITPAIVSAVYPKILEMPTFSRVVFLAGASTASGLVTAKTLLSKRKFNFCPLFYASLPWIAHLSTINLGLYNNSRETANLNTLALTYYGTLFAGKFLLDADVVLIAEDIWDIVRRGNLR